MVPPGGKVTSQCLFALPHVLVLILFYFCSARAVRVHWGHLVRTGVVKGEYNEISINNVVTLGTSIQIVVMRVLALKVFSLICFRPQYLYNSDSRIIHLSGQSPDFQSSVWQHLSSIQLSPFFWLVTDCTFFYRESPMLTKNCIPVAPPLSRSFNRAPVTHQGADDPPSDCL